MPMRTNSSASRLPTIARSTSLRSRSQCSATSSMVIRSSLDLFERVDGGAQLGDRLALRKPVGRGRAIGTDELPRLGADGGLGGVEVLVEVDAAVGGEAVGGDLAERRTKPVVHFERGFGGEQHAALQRQQR